jgi:hypothetical protein
MIILYLLFKGVVKVCYARELSVNLIITFSNQHWCRSPVNCGEWDALQIAFSSRVQSVISKS